MSDTTYIDYVQPAVNAEWLNEINNHVWHDTPVTGNTVHTASRISNTPAGTISATTVQSAINEIVSDLSNNTGASLVGFIQQGTNTVTTTVQEKLRDTVSVKDFTDTAAAISAAKSLNVAVSLTQDTVISVPTDAATLQDAFDYTTPANSSIKVTVNIKAGHALTHGLLLESGDYRQYEIISEDAIVFLDDAFIGVQAETTMASNVIAGINSNMPTLGCLIQADDKSAAGYVVYKGSQGYVKRKCGITHAAAFGLYVINNSKCEAAAANFSYSGLGNRVSTNSMLEAEGINCSYTQNRGYPDPAGDRCGLDVSRGSIVNIKSQGTHITNLSNSAGNGLSVRRSYVSADGIDASNVAAMGIRAESGCFVSASDSTLTGCGTAGAYAAAGSILHVCSSDLSNCTGYGAYAQYGGKIVANSCTINNIIGTGRAVYAHRGGYVEASQATITAALSVGMYATDGGDINAVSVICNMTGSNAGSYAAYADYGSRINVSKGTLSNSSSGQDLRCTRGSHIHAVGATGNPNKAINTLTSDGIIYQ